MLRYVFSFHVCDERREWTATFGPLPHFFHYVISGQELTASQVPDIFETEVYVRLSITVIPLLKYLLSVSCFFCLSGPPYASHG